MAVGEVGKERDDAARGAREGREERVESLNWPVAQEEVVVEEGSGIPRGKRKRTGMREKSLPLPHKGTTHSTGRVLGPAGRARWRPRSSGGRCRAT
eukprot:6435795-Pyramimonas_sp.AAC.1